MKIVFMGTPDFAQHVLESLADRGDEIVAVFTQPDRPTGRSAVLTMPPVKEYALSKGLKVYQPERIRKKFWVEKLTALAPDLMIVAAYGQILPESILQIAPCLNVHASLLPKYRGSSPIQRALADGNDHTGVTIMRMDAGMDTGNILEQVVVPITNDDTGESLFDKLSVAGVEALKTVLDRFAAGREDLIGTAQDAAQATYAPMLSREDGKIDWTRSARLIDCQVRAMTPWPSCYTMLDDKVLKIHRVHPLENSGMDGLVPGTVLDAESGRAIGLDVKNRIVVQTGSGLIQIDQLQLPGKKAMEADVFLRGNPIFGKELHA